MAENVFDIIQKELEAICKFYINTAEIVLY